jgi:hypothetical protein
LRINGVIEAQEAFHARAAAARDGVFGRHVFVRGVVTVRDWGGGERRQRVIRKQGRMRQLRGGLWQMDARQPDRESRWRNRDRSGRACPSGGGAACDVSIVDN